MGETVIDHARTAVTCSTIPSFSQAPIPAERATGTGAAWPAWKIGAVVSALRSTNAEQGSASRLTVADRSRPVVLVPCGPFVARPRPCFTVGQVRCPARAPVTRAAQL